MQRYKVFINEHSISFTEKLENSTIVDKSQCVINPSKSEMHNHVLSLLHDKNVEHLYFVDSEIDTLFKGFKTLFKIVEAAGGRVENGSGQVLFIHRLGKWDLPKGKIEIGEDKRTAAIREVEEECGISKLEIVKQLPTTYHVYELKGGLVLKPTYWFSMSCNDDGELIPQIEEDIEKAVWVDSIDFNEQLSNTYASLKTIISNDQDQ